MKQYKGIFLTILFFISVNLYPQSIKKEITLDDIWTNFTFSPKYPQDIQSMKNGETYCVLEDGIISEYSYKTGDKIRIVLNEKSLTLEDNSPTHQLTKSINLEIESYVFSPDESKILLTTNTKKIYRHSSTSVFYIWDIKKQKILPLSYRENQRLATFSPDNNSLAFVCENNIFIKTLDIGTEQQITNDGKKGSILNGATDWVYEEELDLVKAFEWSPDGKKLAYYRFDESNVKEYSFPVYGDLYPAEYKYKYPKAGENNSIVNIYIYDLASKTAKKIDTGTDTDIYLPRIKWTQDANILSVQRLNRHQNKLEILLADASSGKFKVIYKEENKYYISITDNLTFLKNNRQFLITSERDGYNHIYIYDIPVETLHATSPHFTQVTKGKWDADYKGIDEKNNIIYYTASESAPVERDIYSVKINGENKKMLSKKNGSNDASFNPDFNYYVQSFSDANTPPYYTVNTSDGKELRVLESNSALKDKMTEYGFAKKEFFTFKTSEGIELNGCMIKPADFNPSKKYPVFMEVYGGPGSQTVLDSWGGNDFIWQQLLAQKGYIIVSVDNRGTGNRGEEFKKCTYLQLGKLETDDQIEAAKYLGSLPYVDASRIGIWGWSYGGFMTALCLTKGADYFKTGVAVAPVTNWRYYDNIYTERYMRTPAENQQGYDDNSPSKFAISFKGNLLLIHGLNDDNVHFQNSAEFVMALLKENKQFDTFFYPNKNHFINGGKTRLNLYTKITDYILKNL
jgi:dipeptidyl-peptidase 4